MLARFTFTLSRLRCLRAAMEKISTFRPDGKDLAYVTEQVALAEAAQREFLGEFNAYNLATAALRDEVRSAHEAAVLVYACMKSCYRRDGTCSAAIARLPNHDRTGAATLRRMRGLVACWSTLPPVPGSSSPFAVGPWTQATFAAKEAELEARMKAADLARSVYSSATARLREQGREWNDLVVGALVQGRAMFAPGTTERAYLDCIPTVRGLRPPAQVVVTQAGSPAPGAVHLEFTAERATSYEVWHRGPGQKVFVKVADVPGSGIYDATGVSGGPNEYEVVGENSRGSGPPSAPVTVQVLLAKMA